MARLRAPVMFSNMYYRRNHRFLRRPTRPNMAASTSAEHKQSGKAPGSYEEIAGEFNKMRQQQRSLVNKMSELEMEMKEHDLVIETLKSVPADRRCYRLIGNVLVERTVAEVLPTLQENREQMTKLLDTMQKDLETKARELVEYKTKYGIKMGSEEAVSA